jgi:hypothetical protein
VREVVARYPDGVLSPAAERWIRCVEREILALLAASTSSAADAQGALVRVFSWYPEQALEEGCRVLASTLRSELEHALGGPITSEESYPHTPPQSQTEKCAPSSTPSAVLSTATADASLASNANGRTPFDEPERTMARPALLEIARRTPLLPVTEGASVEAYVAAITVMTTRETATADSGQAARVSVAEITPAHEQTVSAGPASQAGLNTVQQTRRTRLEASPVSHCDIAAVSERAEKSPKDESTVSEIVDRVFATQVLTRWSIASISAATDTRAPQDPPTCPADAVSSFVVSLPTAAPTSSSRMQVAHAPSFASGFPPPNATSA